jgi:beta-phosphoglucomutase-like phosphatase (HAD superfamily)
LVSLGHFHALGIIFDIDGTLTQTMKADEECFVRSLTEVCGFSDVDTDWSRYKQATDSGVFHEIYESHAGRPPSPSEISMFRRHFVALLAQVSSEAAFAAVTGAPLLLSRLAD